MRESTRKVWSCQNRKEIQSKSLIEEALNSSGHVEENKERNKSVDQLGKNEGI